MGLIWVTSGTGSLGTRSCGPTVWRRRLPVQARAQPRQERGDVRLILAEAPLAQRRACQKGLHQPDDHAGRRRRIAPGAGEGQVRARAAATVS